MQDVFELQVCDRSLSLGYVRLHVTTKMRANRDATTA